MFVMKCKNCNRSNRETAHFCKWCGSAIEVSNQTLMPELEGLDDIKEELSDIVKKYEVLSRRAKSRGVAVHMKNDCIILGPAGSGKTSLVKAMARLFYSKGITSKADPVIVDAVEYSGFMDELNKNPQKRLELKDSILCIDNVQKLISRDVTQIADLDQVLMLKKSSNDNDFILVLSGLDTEFSEFLQNNPDVKERFTHFFKLTNYEIPELLAIITSTLKGSVWGLSFTPEASGRLERVLKKRMRDKDEEIKGNGHFAIRFADQIGQNAVERDENAQQILPGDISGEEYVQKSTDEVMASLDKFVGIDEIRKTIQGLVNSVLEAREAGREYELKDHYLFLGNPGTGKTTIARVFADIFCSLDLLPVGQIVEVSRAELVSQWKGETPKEVKRYVEKAKGGILFVDEAYTLVKDDNDDVGKEAVDTLLKLIEDNRGKFVCIAAGYPHDMNSLLDSNPGMRSRFNTIVNFRDYKPDELEQIFRGMMAGNDPPYTLDQDAEDHISIFFKKMYNMRSKGFANARNVRNAFEEAIKRHNNRIQKLRSAGQEVSAERYVFSREDIEGSAADRELTLDEVLKELDEMIGMNEVKRVVRRMANRIKQDNQRMEFGGAPQNAANHIVLTGNPGTGKTTVALMLGKIFKAIGVLPTDKVIEREAKNLKSGIVNETGKIVDKACDEAMGGVLFIDEAYMLQKVDKGGAVDTTGEEAVTSLLTRMENDKGKFIVVMAGYKKEMEEFIDNANMGLRSRIKTFIHIEDYTADELIRIFQMQVNRSRMKLSEQAEVMLSKMVHSLVASKNEKWGNAREMSVLLEKIKDLQSERLCDEENQGVEHTQEQLNTIEACDIPYVSPEPVNPEKILSKLDNLIGLKNVKQEIRELANTLNANVLRAQMQGVESEIQLDHYIFTGNPGTGKTTVAQMMADIFYSLGLLPTNKLVEVTRKDLVIGYIGQTAPNVARVVKSAIGGVLFIDEAYALSQNNDSFGQEAIDTLLPLLLTYKNKFICIVAGYSREMKQWLESNSGLTSRFTETIEFPDYQPDELTEIFRMKAHKEGYKWDEETDDAIEEHFREIFAHRNHNFGNAREVGNFFNKVKKRQSTRLTTLDVTASDFDKEEIFRIIVDDLNVKDN